MHTARIKQVPQRFETLVILLELY